MENCARNIFHQPEVVAFLSDKEKERSTTDRKIVDIRDTSLIDITDHSASSSSIANSTIAMKGKKSLSRKVL